MSKDYYEDEMTEGFSEFDGYDENEADEIYEGMYEDAEDDEEEESVPGKSHRGVKIAAGMLIVIALAVVGLVNGFRLQEVRVSGNKNYTAEEIQSLMDFPENGSNTLLCYFRYMRYKVQDVPFIERIQVRLEGRNTIGINVSEKDILGCIKKGKTYFYFDNEGVIQESFGQQRERIPLIRGVKFENLEVGQKIQAKDPAVLEGVLELGQLLAEYGIGSEEIEIDDRGALTVYIDDHIRVGFGIPVLLEEKMIEVANILPELREMEESEQIEGILHLENYDSTKNSIIFTKEN